MSRTAMRASRPTRRPTRRGVVAKPGASLNALCALTLSAAAWLSGCQPGAAEVATDYRDPSHWLCLPGRADACAVDMDTAVVDIDGTVKQEPFRPDSKAPIDCFYVYPTVSREASGNADLVQTRELARAVALQFARFASVCRLFAPVYRQVTFAGMVSAMQGGELGYSPDLAYRDVAAAWRAYLVRHNAGRGFVLVGHSQGASLLASSSHFERFHEGSGGLA